MYRLFVLPVLFALALPSIQISSPIYLQAMFPKGIPSLLGQYGKVPYGSYITGELVKIPSHLCLPYDVFLNPVHDYIFLIERGDCLFKEKSWNAQIAGAKGVVIYNDRPDEPILTMIGRPSDVEIPSFFIRKEDGETLIQTQAPILLNLTFDLSPFASPSYHIVITGDQAKDEGLGVVVSVLKNEIGEGEFQPLFFVPECMTCSFQDEVEGCMGGGRYCAPKTTVAGVDYLKEIVRQDCIYSLSQTNLTAAPYVQYLIYLQSWFHDCGMNYAKVCLPGLEKAGISVEAVDSCYENSFLGEVSTVSMNSVLSRIQTDFLRFKPNATVYLQHEPYSGELRTDVFKRAVCALSRTLSSACSGLFCAPGCWTELSTNENCDDFCNVADCGFDRYMCQTQNQSSYETECSPGCFLPKLFSGVCYPECNTSACDYGNGVCLCDAQCRPDLLSNHFCDLNCNVSRCGFDDGFCLSGYVLIADDSHLSVFIYSVLITWYPLSSVLSILISGYIEYLKKRQESLLLNPSENDQNSRLRRIADRLEAIPFSPEMMEFGSSDCVICISP